VWAAAWCFHARDDPAAEDWVAVQALEVLAGRARHVAESIAALPARAGWPMTGEPAWRRACAT
jgi:hypothetical protein